MIEFAGPPEIVEIERRPNVEQLIAWGERALGGQLLGDLSQYTEVEAASEQKQYPEGEFDLDDGVILDENSELYTKDEKNKLRSWIEEKLGSTIDAVPVKMRYTSPDETGGFIVFDKAFGDKDNVWYITKWQNEGEKPSFVIWSEDMVSLQEEVGYTRNE